MKLYDFGAVTIFALIFSYSVHVGNTVTEHGTKKATKEDVIAHVKQDLAKFEPSTEFVYNR